MKKNNSKFNIQNSTLIDIPCVILAGGKSSRMGEDKSLLPFGQYDTLIEYQYNKLSKIFSKVYISTKTNKFDFLKESGKHKINKSNLILDETQNISSPMVALQSILKQFNSKVFIVTVDTPLIDKDTFEDLIDKSVKYDITIAKTKNKLHNLCGVFSYSLLMFIEKLIKDDIHKINYMVSSSDTLTVLYDNELQFININTPNEYKKALSIISDTNDNH